MLDVQLFCGEEVPHETSRAFCNIAVAGGQQCCRAGRAYNFAFDTHFKKFKTYKWVEVKEAQKVDDVKDTEIKAALEATLAKNHLTRTDADSADLYIGYQVGVVAEKQLAFYNADWTYGPGWYKEGWYAGSFDYATPSQTVHTLSRRVGSGHV